MGGERGHLPQKNKPKDQHGGKKRPQEEVPGKGSFEALFKILQLKLLEMIYHKVNFNHSFKLLTLCTKLLSV